MRASLPLSTQAAPFFMPSRFLILTRHTSADVIENTFIPYDPEVSASIEAQYQAYRGAIAAGEDASVLRTHQVSRVPNARARSPLDHTHKACVCV